MVRDSYARPLQDLRISVMDRCNFRCPYCMPVDRYPESYRFLPRREQLSFDEIVRLTGVLVGLGARKLRLTGGEPLLRPGLPELVGRLRAIDGVEDIAMTTNGVLLDRYAAALKEAGLDRVTVSVDSLDAETFKRMSGGRGSIGPVLRNIQLAGEVGFSPIKVNTVLKSGENDSGALEILDYFRGTGVIVRFIEYMDVGSINDWRREQVVTSAELLRRIQERWPLRPLAPNYHGEVASRYAYEDGQGEIGFVSSVSQPFCRSCNRARLSSDGCLYTCLFATAGTDLKGPLREGRTDAELLELVAGIWRRREDRYSELRGRQRDADSRIEMYYIGGVKFSHLDENHRPTMVDVSRKAVSARTAVAEARVMMPPPVAAELRRSNAVTKKGAVFDTAIIAGVMAAKKTHELIPFCHPIALEDCKISLEFGAGDEVIIRCRASATHKTGVEMEALTGASVAALTVYDMCKALSPQIVITGVRLLEKRGGKSDFPA